MRTTLPLALTVALLSLPACTDSEADRSGEGGAGGEAGAAGQAGAGAGGAGGGGSGGSSGNGPEVCEGKNEYGLALGEGVKCYVETSPDKVCLPHDDAALGSLLHSPITSCGYSVEFVMDDAAPQPVVPGCEAVVDCCLQESWTAGTIAGVYCASYLHYSHTVDHCHEDLKKLQEKSLCLGGAGTDGSAAAAGSAGAAGAAGPSEVGGAGGGGAGAGMRYCCYQVCQFMSCI